MFQLICHHTYKLPRVAVDLSRFGNHGQMLDVAAVADGSAPGSGAARFEQTTSVVLVPASDSFKVLGALQIDVLVRLEAAPTDRMNLVEGYLAFAFFIEPDGVLTGTFYGPTTLGGAPTWHGVSSRPPNTPDGMTHTVAVGAWTKLSFQHDGIRNLRLFIDDVLVAERRDLVAGVPGVGALGTTIGSWPDARQYTLKGAIDDLKILRRDPDAVVNEFLSRPFTAKEADCWVRVFALLRELFQSDERFIALLLQVKRLIDRTLHAAAGDDDFLELNRKASASFIDLWRTGALASPEMAKLVAEWVPAFVAVAGIKADDPVFQQLIPLIEEVDPKGKLGGLQCDPDFAALIKALAPHIPGAIQ